MVQLHALSASIRSCRRQNQDFALLKNVNRTVRIISERLIRSLKELIFSENPLTDSRDLHTLPDYPTVCERDYHCQWRSHYRAMRHIWERMKIIVEPSSAVPFAALLSHKEKFSGKRIGIILSGGNIDLKKLPWLDYWFCNTSIIAAIFSGLASPGIAWAGEAI